MDKRQITILVVAAVAVVGLVAFILPSRMDNTSANSPAEGSAQLITGDGLKVVDDSGVTTPPEPQPEFEIEKVEAGQKPPQFVVMSFDGGVENKTGIMQHYLDAAKKIDARMSFYISGTYLLPDNKAKLNYNPPGKPRGTSAIGFGDPAIIETRIDKLTEAWNAGHEIGTHYNGHFCGTGGVSSWSAADWTSEINQFNMFLDDWRTFNPQAASAGPLPFNSSVVKGGRTPCLEGKRPAMYKAFKEAGYRYDTSNSGTLTWPKQVTNGLWNIPLQSIKVAGSNYQTLSMDYNFLVNQNNGNQQAPQAKCDEIEDVTYNSYVNALKSVEKDNRAPLILGNHMNDWVCGAYTNALTRFMEDTGKNHPEVKLISSLDLVNWMEAQDPTLLAQWQQMPPAKQ